MRDFKHKRRLAYEVSGRHCEQGEMIIDSAKTTHCELRISMLLYKKRNAWYCMETA